VGSELRWNHRFLDVIRMSPDGSRQIDYARFHETEALPTEASLASA